MDPTALVAARFRESAHLKLDSVAGLAPSIARAGILLRECLQRGGKLLVCGNGGSAADAQHFTAELLGRYERERDGLPAIALHTDTSTLTAVSNDYGYEQVFARQVLALGRSGDTLIAISTSGNSPSILRAVEAAHRTALTVVALTGREGGALASLLCPADVEIRVPATVTARIQEVHILTLHCLCELIDAP